MTPPSPAVAEDAARAPVVLRHSNDGRALEAWSLVLVAIGVEHHVHAAGDELALVVAPWNAARGRAALDAYDRESREDATPDPPAPDRGPSWAGVAIALGLLLFFLVTGDREGADARGFFRAGSAVAELIVAGQLHRTVTALTLHADLMHVVGNGVATVIFLGAVGRWVGGGVGSLLALLAGATGNFVVAHLYGAHHNSIGASTGTFAALGVLGGLQIMRWAAAGTGRMRHRRAYVVAAACLGLFAMLGVGERSDVLAHASGLAIGVAFGAAAGAALRGRFVGGFGQVVSGLAAFALVAGAWVVAL